MPNNDLISRAAAIAELMQMVERHKHETFHGELLHYTGIKAMLEALPAVDAVPVVRCRDCKYSNTIYNTTQDAMPLKCLNIRYGGVRPEWYCEHGERRDEDAADRR